MEPLCSEFRTKPLHLEIKGNNNIEVRQDCSRVSCSRLGTRTRFGGNNDCCWRHGGEQEGSNNRLHAWSRKRRASSSATILPGLVCHHCQPTHAGPDSACDQGGPVQRDGADHG